MRRYAQTTDDSHSSSWDAHADLVAERFTAEIVFIAAVGRLVSRATHAIPCEHDWLIDVQTAMFVCGTALVCVAVISIGHSTKP